jgi:hypothetical protein
MQCQQTALQARDLRPSRTVGERKFAAFRVILSRWQRGRSAFLSFVYVLHGLLATLFSNKTVKHRPHF